MIVSIELEIEDEDLIGLIKRNKKLISDYNKLSMIGQNYNLDLGEAHFKMREILHVSKQDVRSRLFDALVDHKVSIY